MIITNIYIYIYIIINWIGKKLLLFSMIICLHTVKWFQIFLSNTNNLHTVLLLQVFLSHYHYHHHQHQVMQLARISLIFFRQSSLSSIASGRSSSLHPVSKQSCCSSFLLGHPTLSRPNGGVHRRTSLMIWYLLLQQCPKCFVCLNRMVLVIGGR